MSDHGPKTSADALPDDDWASRLTKQVARTVNYYRREMGLTTKALATLCTIATRDGENAREIKPTTLNNLFAGKRKSIGLDEVIIFARVLGVPPIALMVPVGIEDRSEAWPGGARSSTTAFDALVGSTRWGSIFDDVLDWLPEAGQGEATSIHSAAFEDRRRAASNRAHEVTRLMLEHGRLTAVLYEKVLLFHRSLPTIGGFDWDALTGVVRRNARALQLVRERLRDLGLELETLSPSLSWVDVSEVDDVPDEELQEFLRRALDQERGLRFVVKDHRDDGSSTDSAE